MTGEARPRLTMARIIESNMDSIILAPQLNLQEYLQYAHRPMFKHVTYTKPSWIEDGLLPSGNLQALQTVYKTLNIEDDPYVHNLRSQLETLPIGEHRTRVDQKLSKAINKKDTFTHKGLRDFLRAAEDICMDLGPWCADWYVDKVIARAKQSFGPYRGAISAWQEKEKHYLRQILERIHTTPPSYAPDAIRAGVNDKIVALIDCLQTEKALNESTDEVYSCLVFVTRRDEVIAMAEVLQHHPDSKSLFSIGFLIGSSDSQYRKSFLDITRELAKQSQGDTLLDFRTGEKNLIVATAVAEEGLDIQACGTVIRWDLPQNMVSWAQSRGRARRKKSTFVLMFDRDGSDHSLINKWEQLEQQMTALYQAQRNSLKRKLSDQPAGEDEDDVILRVESTG
jgi:endoribonuclease Dicer